MREIHQTAEFRKWLKRLPDPGAKARLVRRVERLAIGHSGDQRSLGGRLFELWEHFGPGYRVYFTHRAADLICLLTAGTKDTQSKDISRARTIIERLDRGA